VRALFAALARITGRSVVVERTGGSMSLTPILERQFPEARFVFLHRNGPDCALSMSRNSAFRLLALRMIAAKYAPDLPDTARVDEVLAAAPDEFKGLIAPPFDKERFTSYPIPLSLFAYMWSYETRTGVEVLREMPRDKYAIVNYEDLLRSPRTELTKLADFLGVSATPQWLDWACGFTNPGQPGSAVSQLSADDLAAVQKTCMPGVRALASLGVSSPL
jgi:hypothetical protein